MALFKPPIGRLAFPGFGSRLRLRLQKSTAFVEKCTIQASGVFERIPWERVAVNIQLFFEKFRAATRGRKLPPLCLAFCILELGFSPGAPAATFTKIDVPGAATGDNQGTVAMSINADGAIAGYYYDA